MQFSNLQYVIATVRRKLRCPDCKNAYKMDEITIVDLYESECMLDLYCNRCKCGFSFNFEIAEIDGKVTVTEKPVQLESQVTEDEVEGIVTLLKNHKGGVGELLGG